MLFQDQLIQEHVVLGEITFTVMSRGGLDQSTMFRLFAMYILWCPNRFKAIKTILTKKKRITAPWTYIMIHKMYGVKRGNFTPTLWMYVC